VEATARDSRHVSVQTVEREKSPACGLAASPREALDLTANRDGLQFKVAAAQ
jgi:hypothetical protein